MGPMVWGQSRRKHRECERHGGQPEALETIERQGTCIISLWGPIVGVMGQKDPLVGGKGPLGCREAPLNGCGSCEELSEGWDRS